MEKISKPENLLIVSLILGLGGMVFNDREAGIVLTGSAWALAASASLALVNTEPCCTDC